MQKKSDASFNSELNLIATSFLCKESQWPDETNVFAQLENTIVSPCEYLAGEAPLRR